MAISLINLTSIDQPSSPCPANVKASDGWLIFLSDCILFAKKSLLKKQYQVKELIRIPRDGIFIANKDDPFVSSEKSLLIVKDISDDDSKHCRVCH
jgi:hypothetical protein